MMGRILNTALLGLLIGGCHVADPAPFNPHDIHQGERPLADVPNPPMRPLPTTLESPYLQTGDGERPAAPTTLPTTGPALGDDPVLRLPLKEILHRAVANNLDVKVAGYEPAVEGTRVTEAEALFDPTFFSRASFQRAETLTGGNATLLGADIFELRNVEADTLSGAVGVKQNLFSGGQIEARYEATRNEFDPRRYDLDPYYESQIILQITQPLLRGFGNEINRARIEVNRLTQRISQLEFRKTLEETLANTERTYWQLVAALREVEIQEELLRQTESTADLLSKRGGQDVTRVQTAQAVSAVEQRRTTLVRAKARVRDLSDQLKRFMADPDLPVSSQTLILPDTAPVETPVSFNLTELIDSAVINRLELNQQQLRIESSGIVNRVARNNLLPQLNLTGSVGAGGFGGDYGDAVDSNKDFDRVNFSIGFEFEIPIGNRAARATYQRSLLQRQQAIDQYRALVEQVSLEIKIALRQVQTRWDEMITTRQARYAAADALRAIQLREENNEPLTPTFVQLKLDSQARLADAAREEINSITNYNNAIAELERAKGTLLRYDNVLLTERGQ